MVKFEEGQRWITRKGNVVTLTYDTHSGYWLSPENQFLYSDHAPEGLLVASPRLEHGQDLLRPHPALADGQNWKTRAGQVTTLTEQWDGSLRGSVGVCQWSYKNGGTDTKDYTVFGLDKQSSEDLMEFIGSKEAT